MRDKIYKGLKILAHLLIFFLIAYLIVLWLYPELRVNKGMFYEWCVFKYYYAKEMCEVYK